jgi:hypothetical protein
VQPRRLDGDAAQVIHDLIGNEGFERRWPKDFQFLTWRWIVERPFFALF